MKKHRCQIYVLFNNNGLVAYVGRTARPIWKRMAEHRSALGYRPKYKVIDCCSTNCREVEKRWIAHYRTKGITLRNLHWGQGPHFLSVESREKLSLALKGRPVTWGRKISAAQKGQKKNWSKAGLKKQVLTRFKPGENQWDKLSPETKKRIRKAFRDQWKNPELRKRMSVGWKKALEPEVRARAGKSISAALKAHPIRTRRIALAAAAKSVKPVKNFWAELRKHPKLLREFLARREKLRMARREAKK